PQFAAGTRGAATCQCATQRFEPADAKTLASPTALRQTVGEAQLVGLIPTWSWTSLSHAAVQARSDAGESPPVRSRSSTGASSPVSGWATVTKRSACATAFAITPRDVKPAGRAK